MTRICVTAMTWRASQAKRIAFSAAVAERVFQKER
jgi:hypothetical protein